MFRVLFVATLFAVALPTSNGQAGGKGDKDSSFIKVQAKGKLITGIVAIGGETTGTIVKTKSGAMELDFGKDKKLRALATKLNKKDVLVEGRLRIEKGLVVRLRVIVSVTSLKAAE